MSRSAMLGARERTVAAPLPPEQRVELLDALRGFALFGILAMNLLGFIGYSELPAEQRAALVSAPLDRASELLLTLLFKGKFYSLFSLLFGIGFAVQMLRAARKGIDFVPLYRRRLTVLVGIGLVHLCLIWAGDILVLYALLGFLLIPLRRLPDRILMVSAALLLTLPVVQHGAVVASGGVLDPGGPLLGLAERMDERLLGAAAATPYLSAAVQGGWSGFVAYNIPGPVWRLGELLQEGRAFKVFAMFLIGLVVARRALFQDLEGHRVLMKKVLVAGLLLGIPANLALAYVAVALRPELPSALALSETLAYTIGVAPLALAYAAAFALLWTRPAARRWLEVPAPAGRMALTNYLMQTVVAISIFYGVGLGMGGSAGPALVIPLALLIFGCQVRLSTLWLRRYRYGPVEWLWRSLTYGETQPMRRPEGVVVVMGVRP